MNGRSVYVSRTLTRANASFFVVIRKPGHKWLSLPNSIVNIACLHWGIEIKPYNVMIASQKAVSVLGFTGRQGWPITAFLEPWIPTRVRATNSLLRASDIPNSAIIGSVFTTAANQANAMSERCGCRTMFRQAIILWNHPNCIVCTLPQLKLFQRKRQIQNTCVYFNNNSLPWEVRVHCFEVIDDFKCFFQIK